MPERRVRGAAAVAAANHEDRWAKSARLATRRVNAAVKALRAVGRLANRRAYHFTDAQISAIVVALTREANRVREQFADESPPPDMFTLPGE